MYPLIQGIKISNHTKSEITVNNVDKYLRSITHHNDSNIKEFHPIALLNSSIKIVIKILANRQASRLQNLAGDYQSGSLLGETFWMISS